MLSECLPPAEWYDPDYDPSALVRAALGSDYEEDPDFGRDEIEDDW